MNHISFLWKLEDSACDSFSGNIYSIYSIQIFIAGKACEGDSLTNKLLQIGAPVQLRQVSPAQWRGSFTKPIEVFPPAASLILFFIIISSV